MRYSVCLNAVFPNVPLEEAVARTRAAGFDTFEFWSWWDRDLDALARAAREHGMTCAAMCMCFISLTDPACRGAFAEGLRESVEAARRLACGTLIVQTGQALAGVAREKQHESIVEGLRVSAPIAEGAGVTLALEPLNTRVDHPGYYLESADEAFRIVKEVGSPAVRMLFDVYHQQITEGDLLARMRADLPLIRHVHIAGNPGRHEPYERSEVDYAAIVTALDEAGYTGAVGLEYFPRRTPEESLKLFLENMPG